MLLTTNIEQITFVFIKIFLIINKLMKYLLVFGFIKFDCILFIFTKGNYFVCHINWILITHYINTYTVYINSNMWKKFILFYHSF